MGIKKMIVYFLLFWGLIAALNFFTPVFYRMTPFGSRRTKLILDYLSTPADNEKNKIIIFGSSMAMSGIDAGMIQEYFDDAFEVINLSSTQQSIQESALYYTKLPAGTKVIVQCINHDDLDSELTIIPKPTLIALSMYDYKLDNEIGTLLPDFNYNLLKKNKLYINFWARDSIKTSLSSVIGNIRNPNYVIYNLNLLSLKYPYVYPSNRSDAYERSIIEKQKSYLLRTFRINSTYLDAINRINNYFASKGILFFLCIMPISTEVTSINAADTECFSNLIKHSFQDLFYFDSYALFDADDFYEGTHLNRIGGRKLTTAVAEELDKRGIRQF